MANMIILILLSNKDKCMNKLIESMGKIEIKCIVKFKMPTNDSYLPSSKLPSIGNAYVLYFDSFSHSTIRANRRSPTTKSRWHTRLCS